MDEGIENRDGGVANEAVRATGDPSESRDTDQHESLIDRARDAIGDFLGGGEEDGPVMDRQSDTTTSAQSAPSNSGNFGSIEDIERDNAAVRHAAEGLDGESLAQGPANTDPDIAQGSF